MSESACKCTLRESLVGDGCDQCNPELAAELAAEAKAAQRDDLLAEIDRIQAERRKNWKSPDNPEDEALEATHARRIQKCREEINRLSND